MSLVLSESAGIYMYVNKINNHKYIGYTNNFKRRYNDHASASFNPKNKDYNNAIHRAIRKYGLNNFDFIILEELNNQSLEYIKDREFFWIKYYNTYENREHYNEKPGGDGVGDKNIHLGEEHGMAILSEEEVIYCRKAYAKGMRSMDVFNEKFKDNNIKKSTF